MTARQPHPLKVKQVPLSLFGALLFVASAAWCNVCGWLLSALHALGAPGCALCWLLFPGIAGCAWKFGRFGTPALRPLTRWRRRVRHPLPALWLLTFLLALIGGLAFEPRNYDFLTYRLSRILHWWAEGRWHWITTNNERMNISGAGFEWVLTPFVILTHSARPAALINVVGFGLLPGLLFRFLTGLGVRPRVAYQWMWLFPGGYCFATQAGSAGNDAFALTFLLAGIVFAFEAAGNPAWWYASVFSAALLTGVKASNLPLIAPILVSWWAVRKLRFNGGAVPAFVTATAAALSSFVPVAIANHVLLGQWAGDAGGASGLQVFNPFAGFAGNLLQLGVNTLLPPFMPFASAWNNVAVPHLLQLPCMPWLKENFPRLDLTVREVASEENTGIGLGVAVLWMALAFRRIASSSGELSTPLPHSGLPRRCGLPSFIVMAGLLSCVVFLAKMGSEAGPRIFAPYYAVLLVAILRLAGGSHPRLRGGWLALCLVVQSVPVLLLLVDPTRNLVPVPQIAHAIIRPPSAFLSRIDAVYSTYRLRADALAPLRDLIPPNVATIGFVADADEPEISLWRPFGSGRRVVDVVNLEKKEALPDYCVALESWVRYATRMPLGDWARAMGLTEVGRRIIPMRAHREPEIWAVLKKSGLRLAGGNAPLRAGLPAQRPPSGEASLAPER